MSTLSTTSTPSTISTTSAPGAPDSTSSRQPSLRGKSVLVTGAASGLGAALAQRLAAAGANIVGVDQQAARLADSLAPLRDYGVQAHPLGADLTDPAASARVVAATLDLLGRLDILINNAGTDVTLPIADLSEGDWMRVLGTNLTAPFLLSKHAAGAMRRQGGGQIVNIASTAAKRAWPNASAYHASKWGLLGLSHALHAELRPDNIRVTAVIAGGMRTPFLLDRFPDLDADTLQDPADVADAIHSVLVLPPATVVAELTVLPLRETSWP